MKLLQLVTFLWLRHIEHVVLRLYSQIELLLHLDVLIL